MSLTDLKKSSDGKGQKKKFTVDEFISDSENYAKGAPEIVSGDIQRQQDLAKAIAGARDLVEKRAEQAKAQQDAPIISAKEKAAQDKQARKLKKKVSANAKQSNKKKYRHATFTLSEEVIAQLQYLADETKLAKSHIIRILIKELDDQDKIDQLELILGSKID